MPSPHLTPVQPVRPCQGAIIGATDWLGSIWDDRKAFSDLPDLVLWGMKDIAFRRKELERWKSELTNTEVHEFQDCGHFLAEEAPDQILPLLTSFMTRGVTLSSARWLATSSYSHWAVNDTPPPTPTC